MLALEKGRDRFLAFPHLHASLPFRGVDMPLHHTYPIHYLQTYWFSQCDHSTHLHHIGVFELSHDGCLLEELDPVLLT